MVTTTEKPLVDARLPEVSALMGPTACHLLSQGLGARVVEARPRYVRYRPGRSITVLFRAKVVGAAEEQALVARAGGTLPAVTVVSEGDLRVAVWSRTRDPLLPGLRLETDPKALASVLRRMGLRQEPSTPIVRAYRPAKRAVLELRHPRVFIKVVLPNQAEALQRLHATVAASLPVPRSLGWSHEDGIVVLEAIPGRTMRSIAKAGDLESLPHPASLHQWLSGLPQWDGMRPVPPPSETATAHAAWIGAVAPELRPSAMELAEAVTSPPEAARGPVHGDFHTGQLIVRSRRVAAVVDIDSIGEGSLPGDLGTLLAHLYLVAVTTTRLKEYGGWLVRHFERLADPRALRLQTAAALVGLATGPFRNQAADWRLRTASILGFARQWVEAASTLPG